MLQARGTAAAPILTIDALDPVYGKTTSAMPTLQNFRDGFASESVYAQDLLTRGDFTLLLGGRWNSFREKPHQPSERRSASRHAQQGFHAPRRTYMGMRRPGWRFTPAGAARSA